MHSHGRSRGLVEEQKNRTCDRLRAQYETSDEFENERQDVTVGTPFPRIQDNVFPSIDARDLLRGTSCPKRQRLSGDIKNLFPREEQDEHFQVPIPTFSTGLTTFAYQQVLRNRILVSKFSTYAEFDVRKYTPTFIHDCLMLPGSLASVLGKPSSLDIIHKMTPALLPGFRVLEHAGTQTPCLVKSSEQSDYVQGILIFGQGTVGRNCIHAHYRPHARRVKVEVEFDVIRLVPWHDRDFPLERWRLQRRKIEAHAWVASKVYGAGIPWTLEEHLERKSERGQSLRIEPSAYGIEEDGGVSVACSEDEEPLSEPREVLRGGCGNLDYERAEDGWTGW